MEVGSCVEKFEEVESFGTGCVVLRYQLVPIETLIATTTYSRGREGEIEKCIVNLNAIKFGWTLEEAGRRFEVSK